LSLSLSLAAPAAAAPAAKIRVAVLRVDALGIPRATVDNLAMLLRNSIATIGGFEVISPVQIDMEMRNPRNKAVASCEGGPECAVQVGRIVRADRVVFGTIGELGQDFSLNLRMLDVKKGVELARQQGNVSGNRDMLIPEIRLAAFRLLAPDRIRGALLIDIDVIDVDVEVDGAPMGKTPLTGPIENLTPGDHKVRLHREGFSEFVQTLAVRAFETSRLKVELKKTDAAAAPPAK